MNRAAPSPDDDGGGRSSGARPCVFFDRDGVVNRSPGAGYVLSWTEFQFLPGLFDLLRLVAERGYAAIVVTSQRCVGKGLLSETALGEIHRRMQRRLEIECVPFLDLFVCTGQAHDLHWTKPNPGMILEAAARHGLDLERSWLIGDQDRDIAMAQAAGVPHSIRVRGEKPIGIEAEHTVDELAGALEILRTGLVM